MWPKAFTQLVELAPHITRLLPLADRYFKDKTAGEDSTQRVLEGHRAILQSTLEDNGTAQDAKLEARFEAQRVALSALSERVHADLGAIMAAQLAQANSLERQIGEFDKHLTTARVDALSAKQATEALDGRLARAEAAQRRTQTLVIVALALLVAILVLIATIFLRTR